MRAPVANPLYRPARYAFAGWNWKTAAVSAVLRAALFFATNRRASHAAAFRSAVVEALFAIVAAGLLGAATQKLRDAKPVAVAAGLVWLGLPALAVAAQALVHHLAGTPHLSTGLWVSFVFASIASGCTWVLQRRGFLLTGGDGTSRERRNDEGGPTEHGGPLSERADGVGNP